MICEACANAAHWACTGAGCACDCDPEAVLAALDQLDPLVAREYGVWDVYDDPPCPWCGEAGCERSCTGALLAREDPHGETP